LNYIKFFVNILRAQRRAKGGLPKEEGRKTHASRVIRAGKTPKVRNPTRDKKRGGKRGGKRSEKRGGKRLSRKKDY
jgi:hypothetical protein